MSKIVFGILLARSLPLPTRSSFGLVVAGEVGYVGGRGAEPLLQCLRNALPGLRPFP